MFGTILAISSAYLRIIKQTLTNCLNSVSNSYILNRYTLFNNYIDNTFLEYKVRSVIFYQEIDDHKKEFIMLNHIYCVIFNRSTGCYVAVSKITKSGGKSSRSGTVGSIKSASTGAKSLRRHAISVAAASVLGLASMGSQAFVCVDNTAATGNSTASGSASACGTNNQSSGNNSSAFGVSNTVTQFIAQDPTKTNRNGSALGVANTVSARQASAVGYSNEASGINSSALGNNNEVSAGQALAVGYENKASGVDSAALGRGNEALNDESSALGYENKAAGDNSSAIGHSNETSGSQASAVGYNNTSSAENSLAVGSNATANIANSIALGERSVTTVDAGVKGFGAGNKTDAAWQSTLAAVSVGDSSDINNLQTRQITGLAAGTNDTDAVNVAQLITKADITYVDSENNAQNTVIATKADITYVDSENNAQNTVIATKADITYVDSENNAQNTVIATKVDTTTFNTDQNRQDAVIATKADTAYVDNANNAQNIVINKNVNDIIGLKVDDFTLNQKIETNNTNINNRVDKVIEVQGQIDDEQNKLITQNTSRFEGLNERVNSLDEELSSGVASALAISSMPTMSIPGAHMITGGSGYFNGQGSLAIGMTGTNNTGKVSYKIGGSYTQKGGSAFSVGGGYRWK